MLDPVQHIQHEKKFQKVSVFYLTMFEFSGRSFQVSLSVRVPRCTSSFESRFNPKRAKFSRDKQRLNGFSKVVSSLLQSSSRANLNRPIPNVRSSIVWVSQLRCADAVRLPRSTSSFESRFSVRCNVFRWTRHTTVQRLLKGCFKLLLDYSRQRQTHNPQTIPARAEKDRALIQKKENKHPFQ